MWYAGLLGWTLTSQPTDSAEMRAFVTDFHSRARPVILSVVAELIICALMQAALSNSALCDLGTTFAQLLAGAMLLVLFAATYTAAAPRILQLLLVMTALVMAIVTGIASCDERTKQVAWVCLMSACMVMLLAALVTFQSDYQLSVSNVGFGVAGTLVVLVAPLLGAAAIDDDWLTFASAVAAACVTSLLLLYCTDMALRTASNHALMALCFVVLDFTLVLPIAYAVRVAAELLSGGAVGTVRYYPERVMMALSYETLSRTEAGEFEEMVL